MEPLNNVDNVILFPAMSLHIPVAMATVIAGVTKNMKFAGPIRLIDDQCVDPLSGEGVSCEGIDVIIAAYKEGDDCTIQPNIFRAVFNRAVYLYLAQRSEPARLLLRALAGEDMDPFSREFLAGSPAPLLDALLHPSSEHFGSALESKNPIFHARNNNFFTDLFWTGFVVLCQSALHRPVMTRLYPLVIFVARCSEFEFAKAVARYVFCYEDRAVADATLSKLAGFEIGSEQRKMIGDDLVLFLGRNNAVVAVDSLTAQGILSASPATAKETGMFTNIVDLLSPFISIGYAGAPFWSHHLLDAISIYIQEACLSEQQIDCLLAELFYFGVAIAEPFHLSRRLITLSMHIERYGLADSRLKSGFGRFMSNESSAITSTESRKNHQETIEKVNNGLHLLHQLKIDMDITGALLPSKRSKAALFECEMSRIISDSPFLVIPDSFIRIVSPKHEELQAFHSQTRESIMNVDMYDRCSMLINMLDPLETSIMGVPSKPLYICFSEEDCHASSEQESSCILLKQKQ